MVDRFGVDVPGWLGELRAGYPAVIPDDPALGLLAVPEDSWPLAPRPVPPPEQEEAWEPEPQELGEPGDRRAGRHARPARPRRRWRVPVMVRVLVVLGAVLAGFLAVRVLIHHHGGVVLKTAPGAAVGYTATAGPGCPPEAGADGRPYQAVGGDEWFGGTASASGPCGRGFRYVYLSVAGSGGGWRDHYDWVFRTGRPDPSCTLSIWIPAAAQANSAVYYWFSAGGGDVGRIADFTISQAAYRGRWVTEGPFTFPGGMVLLEATDRGGGGSLSASVAAGPVRVNC